MSETSFPKPKVVDVKQDEQIIKKEVFEATEIKDWASKKREALLELLKREQPKCKYRHYERAIVEIQNELDI